MSDTIGVFPLPGVVLFPEAILPLHVFEPRYRALVRDALAGDRSFALALLKPGYEQDYDGSPEIYPVGCEGRIEEAVPLPDGRFVITLRGTRRIELGEMTSATPYRTHRRRPRPERLADQDSDEARDVLLRLLSAWHQIAGATLGRSEAAPIPTGLPLNFAVHRIAFGLDLDPIVKYRILETDDALARAVDLAGVLESALPQFLNLDSDNVN